MQKILLTSAMITLSLGGISESMIGCLSEDPKTQHGMVLQNLKNLQKEIAQQLDAVPDRRVTNDKYEAVYKKLGNYGHNIRSLIMYQSGHRVGHKYGRDSFDICNSFCKLLLDDKPISTYLYAIPSYTVVNGEGKVLYKLDEEERMLYQEWSKFEKDEISLEKWFQDQPTFQPWLRKKIIEREHKRIEEEYYNYNKLHSLLSKLADFISDFEPLTFEKYTPELLKKDLLKSLNSLEKEIESFKDIIRDQSDDKQNIDEILERVRKAADQCQYVLSPSLYKHIKTKQGNPYDIESLEQKVRSCWLTEDEMKKIDSYKNLSGWQNKILTAIVDKPTKIVKLKEELKKLDLVID